MTYEQKCKKIMNSLDKSERSDYNKSILKFLEQRQVLSGNRESQGWWDPDMEAVW